MVLYATLLGQAWNILAGFGGQFSFGHAVFFGTGAYAAAVLQVRLGWNAWAALPLRSRSAPPRARSSARSPSATAWRLYFALSRSLRPKCSHPRQQLPFTGAGVGR